MDTVGLRATGARTTLSSFPGLDVRTAPEGETVFWTDSSDETKTHRIASPGTLAGVTDVESESPGVIIQGKGWARWAQTVAVRRRCSRFARSFGSRPSESSWSK